MDKADPPSGSIPPRTAVNDIVNLHFLPDKLSDTEANRVTETSGGICHHIYGVQAERIKLIDRIVRAIDVKIRPACDSDRICLKESSHRRVIISRPVIIQSRLRIQLSRCIRIRLEEIRTQL